jgi:hypothetical protein
MLISLLLYLLLYMQVVWQLKPQIKSVLDRGLVVGERWCYTVINILLSRFQIISHIDLDLTYVQIHRKFYVPKSQSDL